MSRNYSIGLALLDIIGCALGASVVLAVIFSVIRIPPPPLAPNEFILVQASGRWQARAEIPDDPKLVGFFIRAPDGPTLIVPPLEGGIQEARNYLVDEMRLAASIDLVSAWSPDLQQQVSYLSIAQPSPGEWQVLPYYYDFPSWLTGNEVRADSLGGLAVEYWTSKETWKKNAETEIVPEPMSHPGFDSGGNLASRTLRINISG